MTDLDMQYRMDLVRRPRRLRTSSAMRELVAETHIEPRHFIMPYFVVEGEQQVQPIATLPGVSRFSVDMLMGQLERTLNLGIKSVMLFGVLDADKKDEVGTTSFDPEGPVNRALREARKNFGNDLVLMTDVCLCGYTDHGHCGIIKQSEKGPVVDNDPSLDQLNKMALSHAEAGADMVAPSDMMDGRVGSIREYLDDFGHSDVGILAYSVKYASAFYGPFRDAAGSSPKDVGITGRHSYQMDSRNVREALSEMYLDEAEGADMMMVKPALAYLDVIRQMREHTALPVVAYNVSGEYAMIKAAVAAGVLDEAAAVRESLLAMRRAGADLIISYFAVDAIEKSWL